MKRTMFLIVLILIGVCCVSMAGADGINFSQGGADSNFVHSMPITVTYNVSQLAGRTSGFDHAELRAMAWYEQNYYEFDPVRLSGTSGTYVFSDTELGDYVWFTVVLKDKSDMYLGEIQGKDAWFTDSWNNKPAIPTLTVTRNQTSVTAGTPISASYQITGGSGNIKENNIGWVVRDQQGSWITSTTKVNSPASGTLTLDAPSAKGTHYVEMSLKDANGWTFQAEAHDQGIEVTTDGTSEPLSISLTWKDKNGKVLDWTKDKAEQNQRIYLTWKMQGGYTPYEGYLNLNRVSGETSFLSMGNIGASGTLEFSVSGQQDAVIGIEYHDNHGNSKTQQVTIPMEKIKPVLYGDYIWLDGSADEIDYTMYKGIPLTSQTTVWQRSDFIKYSISNYDEMKRTYGGEPVWSVHLSTNIPGYEEKNEGQRFIGMLDSIPEQLMDAEAVLTCSWGGQTASKTVRLHVVEPNFQNPAGIDNVSDTIETQIGNILTIQPEILPPTWSLSGYSPIFFCANGFDDFVGADNWIFINSMTGAQCEIRDAGIFSEVIGLSYGALMVTKPVTFEVKDKNGNVPSDKLTLSQHDYDPHINRYLGMTNEIEEQTGVFSWNLLAGADIVNFEYLKSKFGGRPKWTVTQTGGEELPITWSVEMDGRRADVRLEAQDLTDVDYQPGQAQITITCEWGGETATAVTDIDLLYPPNGLPSGIDYNNGSDTVECQVGDTLRVEPTILPANWKGIPGYASVYAGNSGEFEEFCEVIREGTWGRELEVVKPGIYQCFIGVGTDTITAGRWVTYRVKDENGTIPVPDAEFDGYFGLKDSHDLVQTAEYFVAPGIGFTSADDVLYSTDYLFTWGITNVDPIWNYLEEEPVFDVELVSGNVKYSWETDEQGAEIYVNMTEMPAAGSATFKATCTVLGKTYEQTVNFLFTEVTSFPTGLEGDLSSPKIMKVGDEFPFWPQISFADGWHVGDGNGTGVLYGGTDEFFDMIDWGKTSTVAMAGEIDVPLVAYSENLYMERTVRYIFTEESPLSISGDKHVKYQIGLPTEQPAGGGFYNRGPLFWLNGYTEGHGDPVWSITPTNGGPNLLMQQAHPWSPNESQIRPDPNATYTAGTTEYNYRISCSWNGSTCTKDIGITFIDELIPTGYSVSCAPVDLSTSPATVLSYIPYTNGVVRMKNGTTYVVSEDISGLNDTFQSYSMNEADWSDYEWEEIEPEDDNRFMDSNGRCVIDTAHKQVYTVRATGTYDHSYVVQFQGTNLGCYIPYRLIVSEADNTIKASDYQPVGTVTSLPANLTKIDSEAFARTKLTEVDIPAGTEIADDAFAGTGLIAIYTHDAATIQWALNHGILAVVE